MHPIKQQLRQPLKTAMGLLLIALAAAIAFLCVGQSLAAKATKEALDQRFSTLGIPLVQEDPDGNVTADSFALEEEFLGWLEEVAARHPQIVRTLARHGSLNANIPALTPMNPAGETAFYTESLWDDYLASPENMPYSCAMLMITLESVSEATPVTGTYPVEDVRKEQFASASDYYAWLYTDPDTETVTCTRGYTVTLTGTVTQSLFLAEGYGDPVGRTARLRFTAPAWEQIEDLNLTPGKSYIVFGMDYTDEHKKLISTLDPNGYMDYLQLDVFDPEKLRLLTEEELRENLQWAEAFPEEMGNRKYDFAIYSGFTLTREQYLQLNAVSMTLRTPVPLTLYEEVRDPETGTLLELLPGAEVTCTTPNGDTLCYTPENYIARYAVPTVAPLPGTPADFLADGENAPWQKALEYCRINSHAFSLIGVDKMAYLADFSLKRSNITAGRDFTPEELAEGSRVCILHDSLAQRSGIQLGDRITVNFYQTDYALPYQQFWTQGKGLLRPSPSFCLDTTPFLETAEYTVVGFWHGQQLWPDAQRGNEYAFSPNTVFVPESSVQTPMEKGRGILFNTLVLHNTQIEEFHQLAAGAGYAGRFQYNDQDYSVVAANFHNYDVLSGQMLAAGALLYGVLLLLFLLLYPRALTGTVQTMRSLGAGCFRRFRFVLVCALWLLLPGEVLGSCLGAALWDRMITGLQDAAQCALPLSLSPEALAAVSAGQLLLALLLTLLTSVWVAGRDMSSRR